jgi:hypothetical protein
MVLLHFHTPDVRRALGSASSRDVVSRPNGHCARGRGRGRGKARACVRRNEGEKKRWTVVKEKSKKSHITGGKYGPDTHEPQPDTHEPQPDTHTPARHPRTPARHPRTPARHPHTPARHPRTPARHPRTPVRHPSTPARGFPLAYGQDTHLSQRVSVNIYIVSWN